MVLCTSLRCQGLHRPGGLLVPTKLGDGERAIHASATVGLAEVAVISGGVELHDEGVANLAKLLVHRDLLLIDAGGDLVFVEDNIVGATLVVDPEIRQESETQSKWTNFVSRTHHMSRACEQSRIKQRGGKSLASNISGRFNVPLDGVALADGSLGGDELESSGVGAHLNLLRLGGVSR